jgi:hypothetical protein
VDFRLVIRAIEPAVTSLTGKDQRAQNEQTQRSF